MRIILTSTTITHGVRSRLATPNRRQPYCSARCNVAVWRNMARHQGCGTKMVSGLDLPLDPASYDGFGVAPVDANRSMPTPRHLVSQGGCFADAQTCAPMAAPRWTPRHLLCAGTSDASDNLPLALHSIQSMMRHPSRNPSLAPTQSSRSGGSRGPNSFARYIETYFCVRRLLLHC